MKQFSNANFQNNQTKKNFKNIFRAGLMKQIWRV